MPVTQNEPFIISAIPDPTDPVKWQVFENTDGDIGGWFSYVEGGGFYLGGELFPTKREAEADARIRARDAVIPGNSYGK